MKYILSGCSFPLAYVSPFKITNSSFAASVRDFGWLQNLQNRGDYSDKWWKLPDLADVFGGGGLASPFVDGNEQRIELASAGSFQLVLRLVTIAPTR